MSTIQQQTSSSSDVDFDERKRKRMISNRESSRRSRMRKQKLLDDLMGQSSQLEKDNKHLAGTISVVTEKYLGVASENNVLRAQLFELSNRLQSLNSVLQIAAEVNGMPADIIPGLPENLAGDIIPWLPENLAADIIPGLPENLEEDIIPELPENMMEPLQLPCPTQPITASADMFQY